MTPSVSTSIEQATPYPVVVSGTDYIMVHDVEQRSPAVRAQKRQHVRTVLKTVVEKYVTSSSHGVEQINLARTMAVSAAAILQLSSPEAAVPNVALVSRQLNEILPLIGNMIEPPVVVPELEVEQVSTLLQDAETQLRAPEGWSQPHDVSSMDYYDRVVGLDTGNLIFGDLTPAR